MGKPHYQFPATSHHIHLEIKRSKFLTFAAPAENRQTAEDFIRGLREQHPRANHVCWAYIAGAPNSTVRSMSDDGEPSGTAGMPMLKILEYSGYGDIVVVVVRYFGGTKLGTGGLQRAYSDAVSKVLADLPLLSKVERTALQLTYDYPFDGVISRLLDKYDVAGVTTGYGQNIYLAMAIATDELATFKIALTNITGGNVEVIVDEMA